MDLVARLAAVAADSAPALNLPALDDWLKAVAVTSRRVFGAKSCSIAVLHEDEELLEYRIADGAGAAGITGVSLEIERGLAGYVASSGQAISVESVRDDPRFAADIAEKTGYIPDRALLAPIVAPTGEVLGVLTVLDRDPSMAGGDAIELAYTLAEQAAVGLRLSHSVDDLGSALLGALADAHADDVDLAKALRARAEETPGAQGDIARVAAVVGELRRLAPGLSRTAVSMLEELVAYAKSARGRRR
jgi:GAF domain-containing protein